MPTQQELIELRRRFLSDFEFYAKHSLRIRTKEGEIKHLVLNEAQKEMLWLIERQFQTDGYIRAICLRGRQMGISTFIEAYIIFKVTQSYGHKGLVLAHKAESSSALFTMTKRYWENLPGMLKPSTKYSSKKELVFDKLDSSLMVATAGGDSIARGETLQWVHASEAAFWPSASADENLNALLQAVPNSPNTGVFIESTANGFGNMFEKMWTEAVNGESGYLPIFLVWTMMPEYRETAPENFEHSPEEEELVSKFGLTDDQLFWRRRKISAVGLDKFRQEYPLTPEEAFIASGRPVFNPDIVNEMLQNAEEPIERRALEANGFELHPRGELAIYIEHDPLESYIIGADVGKGVKGGDYSVAQVLNSKKQQVAVWRGRVVSDYFAHVLNALGNYYNTAEIICEANDHGILTLHVLAKELQYPAVWQDQQYDKVDDIETVKLGIVTNVKSKPLVIDKLRADLRDRQIELTDATTIKELLTYIFTESGKMQAEEGKHDDCVMSLAFANHAHEGILQPVTNKDSYYVDML